MNRRPMYFKNLLNLPFHGDNFLRVHKSPHKFMLTSYMKYFAKFLVLLLHNT